MSKALQLCVHSHNLEPITGDTTAEEQTTLLDTWGELEMSGTGGDSALESTRHRDGVDVCRCLRKVLSVPTPISTVCKDTCGGRRFPGGPPNLESCSSSRRWTLHHIREWGAGGMRELMLSCGSWTLWSFLLFFVDDENDNDENRPCS